MTDNIIASGKYTLDDYKCINKYLFINTCKNKKIIFALFSYFIICLKISTYIKISNRTIQLIVWFSSAIGLMLLIILLMRILSNLFLKKRFNSIEMMRSEYIITISDEGIFFEYLNGNCLYKWDWILEIKKYDDNYMLSLKNSTKNSAISILKRFFKNEEDIIKFENIVKEKMISKNVKL